MPLPKDKKKSERGGRQAGRKEAGRVNHDHHTKTKDPRQNRKQQKNLPKKTRLEERKTKEIRDLDKKKDHKHVKRKKTPLKGRKL